MTILSNIVALLISLLTNVISVWIEPSLSKNKLLTTAIIVGLGVSYFYFTPKQKNEKQKNENITDMKPPKTSFIKYIVQENESVYLICKKYKTTAEELQKLNPKVISKDKNNKWVIKPRYEINIEIKN